jgi:trehalose/maltose hydrolase-like predicted phosphorylase
VNSWLLRYEGYDAASEGVREVLCALGNGRFATRAAAPEATADGTHYPGTYVAGVFDRIVGGVDGHTVSNESIVNLPDWQSLRFRFGDGDWFDLGSARVESYVQELDLRRGVLVRRFVVVGEDDRRTSVAQRRFVSMADPFVGALDTTFVPRGWSGSITVRSGVDGRVTNAGVPRYRGLGGDHLDVVGSDVSSEEGVCALDVVTRQSRRLVSTAVRHRLLSPGGEVKARERHELVEDRWVGEELVLDAHDGEPVTVEKVAVVVTSRDRAISTPAEACRDRVRALVGFDALLRRHVLAWDHLWTRCDLAIEVEPEADREAAGIDAALVLRLHLFHLLQTVSTHSIDLDVGIPARGLVGEAYRGHVFWDDVFVFPWLALRMPELARSLLLYRWRRLPEARRAAHAAGLRGALFPWQSGSDGREETQRLHLNPRSGHWLEDHSDLQRHIGLAVAWNTWHYYEATGDLDFLAQQGAELVLEVARLFAGLATYDRASDRYRITGVVGPDEYHDAYPWRDEPGLDDNAYTNVMASWVLSRALLAVDALPERRRQQLLDLLEVRREDLELWDHVSRRLRLCWTPSGVLLQFDGYDRLEELDWAGYIERYGDISRLDRILEAEGDSTNRYQLAKQADVLMLFYLLTAEELQGVVERLGYRWDPFMVERNTQHYLQRTAHGSTLSKLVHAWVLARTDRPAAWRYFLEALESDVADVQGGTTREGIHLGAMAGTIDLLQRGFTGLSTRGAALRLDPCLPDGLRRLAFRMRFREHYGLEVVVTHDELAVGGHGRPGPPLVLVATGRRLILDPSGRTTIPLTPPPAPG